MCPELDALVVTPVCPHSLSNRPIVLTGSSTVRLVNESADVACMASTDGRPFHEILPGAEITIRRFAHRFRLVETARRTFFRTLRDKLNWGGHPNYDVG